MRDRRNRPTVRATSLRVETRVLLSMIALGLAAVGGVGQTGSEQWTLTGQLNTPRYRHTATLLPNGKVLVAGGIGPVSCSSPANSAELYSPINGTWSITGSLNTARTNHTATLLQNGQVLVLGGYDAQAPLSSAELYNPGTGLWRSTRSFNSIRSNGSATLLSTGKVLAVGVSSAETITAELYDPATETWTLTGAPSFVPSLGHTVLLPDGKVLAVLEGSPWDYSFVGAELYNPATGEWSTAGYPNIFWAPTVTLLRSGQVLITGLYGANNPTQAELYNTNTGTWRNTGNLSTYRHYGGYTATLLANDQVLVVGGFDYRSNQPVNAEELYDPATGIWTSTSRLINGRDSHTATLLPSGKVLVAGGLGNFCDIHASAELFDPVINSTENPIDNARLFVYQHYLDFLTREPDQEGWDYWTAQITDCGNDSRCIHERRIGVSGAFFVELEFQKTGYVVYRLHRAAFGEVVTACSSGFDEEGNPCEPRSRTNIAHSQFVTDRAQVVGGPALPQSTISFANDFVQRPEFKEAYPEGMSAADFVNRLFDTAGLTGSANASLRQAAIDALMNGSKTRAQILLDLIEINDFKTQEYNAAFVLMQYFGYLRRDPDEAGYYFWLDVLNNREPNNFRGMICAFLTSSEYQLRFGSNVTRSNLDCRQ